MAREGDERLLAPERSAAIEALRDIDAHHFARISAIVHWMRLRMG